LAQVELRRNTAKTPLTPAQEGTNFDQRTFGIPACPYPHHLSANNTEIDPARYIGA